MGWRDHALPPIWTSIRTRRILSSRPFVVLNATDMASGEVFAFTPKRFDDICSDFDQQPVSVGVAASAAFPIAFTPVAFQNYSVASCPDRPMPTWVSKGLTRRYTPYIDVEG